MRATGRISPVPGAYGSATVEVGEVSRSLDDLGPATGNVLAEVTELIRQALSDYGEWTGVIAPDARLDADLGMQSVELAGLQLRMEQRWGAAGDLDLLLRTLDLAGLTELTVADVARRVAGAGPVA